MSYALRDKNKLVPNGYRFYQPQTKWTAVHGSFRSVTQQVLVMREGNAGLCKLHNLSLDPAVIEVEVEQFNIQRCLDNKWHHYLIGSPAEGPWLPKRSPRSLIQSLAGVAAGAKTVVEWIRSGTEAVTPELSRQRAEVCSRCPQNAAGDLTSFFTVPASRAIQAALQLRSEWKLSTPRDEQLGVCVA